MPTCAKQSEHVAAGSRGEAEKRPPGSDWITVIAVLVGIMIVLVVLSEVWMPHPG